MSKSAHSKAMRRKSRLKKKHHPLKQIIQKKSDAVESILNRKSRLTQAELQEIRDQPTPVLHKILNAAKWNRRSSSFLLPPPHLKSYSDFDFHVRTAPLRNLSAELRYATAIFHVNSDGLRAFILSRQQFETALLTAQYANALDILNQVEKSHGKSFWLAEARLLHADQTDGLKGNRETLREFIAEEKTGAAAILLTFLSSPGQTRTKWL